MSMRSIRSFLASAVAPAGTFTVQYPAGATKNTFVRGVYHQLIALGTTFRAPLHFTLTFNATNVTVTMASTGVPTLPANTEIFVGFDSAGDADQHPNFPKNLNIREMLMYELNLGSPIVGAVTQIATAQLLGSATNFAIDGTLASGGIATADRPRNVTLTVATTDHSGKTVTIYGTDEYGVAMTETITGPNNNTVQGVKAFKTVTRAASSAAIATNGISIGFGNKLGLPCVLPNSVNIFKELEDGALATSGTTVAAVASKATATTGDVRGTYTPNSTPDGSKGFSLLCALWDPADRGVDQA